MKKKMLDISDDESSQTTLEIYNERQSLQWHDKMYKQSRVEASNRMNQFWEVDQIKAFFHQNKVQILKLNSNMDLSVQRHT